MQVNKPLAEWLLNLGIIERSDVFRSDDDRLFFSEGATESFLSGVSFLRALKTCHSKYPDIYKGKFLPSVEFLKPGKNHMARQFNWDFITECFRRTDLVFDKDVKNLIVSGDSEMVADLLNQLKLAYERAELQQLMHARSKVALEIKTKEAAKKDSNKFKRDQDLLLLDTNKPLHKTLVLPEFLLMTVCKHFDVNAVKAATLLTDHAKYLTHIIAKGVKGSFAPVLSWYEDLVTYLPHVFTIVDLDHRTKTLNPHIADFIEFMTKIHGGLVSRSYEVVDIALKLFISIGKELQSKGKLKIAADWFAPDKGEGLQNVLLCFKRHPESKAKVVELLLTYGKSNLYDTFTVQLRKMCGNDQKELLEDMTEILPALVLSQQIRSDLLLHGVIDDWLGTAVNVAETEHKGQADLKIHAMRLIVDLWIHYPEKLQEVEEFAKKMISIIRKFGRDKKITVANCAIVQLFRLLDRFYLEKNNFGQIVYRALVGILIENANDLPCREFIIHNFIGSFKMNPEIPLHLLIEPLIKAIGGTERVTYILNMIEYNLFNFCANHSTLSPKVGLHLIEVISKLYLSNIFAARTCLPTLKILMNRFQKNQLVVDSIVKIGKSTLTNLLNYEKKREPPPDPKEQKKGGKIVKDSNSPPMPPGSPRSLANLPSPGAGPGFGGLVIGDNSNTIVQKERAIQASQKRGQVVELLKVIIGLKLDDINEKFKPQIISTNQQIRFQTKKNSKALMALIALFGNPTEILAHEADFVKQAMSFIMKKKGLTGDKLRSRSSSQSSRQDSKLSFSSSGKMSDLIRQLQRQGKLTNILDPRVRKMLNKAKRKHKEKVAEQEAKKKEKEEKEKKIELCLDRMIELRKVELGASRVNEKKITLLFPEGKMTFLKEKEDPDELPEPYLHFDMEEDYIQEWMDCLKRRYNKAIVILFDSYAGSAGRFRDTIEVIRAKKMKISDTELSFLLKDNDLIDYLPLEHITALARKINIEMKDDYEPALTIDLFELFLINTAVLIFSRSPWNLGHEPVPALWEKLMIEFRNSAKMRGESVVVYDEPELIGARDAEVLRYYNHIVKTDPNATIPREFQKYHEKRVDFLHVIPASLNVGEGHAIAYSIVDDLLNHLFNFHVLEPMHDIADTLKVRQKQLMLRTPGLPSKYDMTKMNRDPEHVGLATGRIQKKGSLPQVFSPRAPLTHMGSALFQPPLSFPVRVSLQEMDGDDRDTAEVVGALLYDVVEAVARGRDRITRRTETGMLEILNRARSERKAIEDEMQEIEERRNNQVQERRRLLSEKLKELKPKHEEEERRKKKEEVDSKKKAREAQARLDEERKKFFDELLGKAKARRKQEAEEKEAAEREKKEEEERKKEDKKKEFEEFNKKQVERYNQRFKEIEDKRKQRDEEKKNAEQKLKSNQEHWAETRKQEMEKLKAQREREREQNQQIMELHKSKEMAPLYEKYKSQIDFLFEYYTDQNFIPIDTRVDVDEMQYLPFVTFAKEFNIVPSILPLHEINVLYKTLTKPKPMKENLKPGLTLDEFKQALLRIAIKARKKFDDIFHRLKNKRGTSSGQNNTLNLSLSKSGASLNRSRDEGMQSERDIKVSEGGATERDRGSMVDDQEHSKSGQDEDHYDQIEETTIVTMEGLLMFLDLPDNHFEMVEAVKVLREQHIPNQKKKKLVEKKLNDILSRPPRQKRQRKGSNDSHLSFKPRNGVIDEINNPATDRHNMTHESHQSGEEQNDPEPPIENEFQND